MQPFNAQLIHADRLQPDANGIRRTWTAEHINGLKLSIQVRGILQPLVVQPLVNTENYSIIDGNSRFAAGKAVGVVEFSCVALDKNLTLAEARIIALTIHLQRENPSFIDLARAMDEAKKLLGLSNVELARQLGISPPTVCRHLSVLELPPDDLAKLGNGLSLAAAYGLVKRPRKKSNRKCFRLRAADIVLTLMADGKATVAALKQWVVEITKKLEGLDGDAPLSKI